MTPSQDGQRLPRGLQIYFGLVLAFLATFVLTAPWRIGGREVGRLSPALWLTLDLSCAVLFYPPWRRSLVRLFRDSDVRISRRAVLLGAAVAGLFLCRVVVARYAALDINAWDTGLYFDGPIAETLAGRPLFCAYTGRSYLAIHGSYLLFAFVPLYAIAASAVWLLAAQAAALATAVAVAFLFFRRLLDDDLAGAFLAAGFLLNTYTAKTVQYAFHVEVFYPLAIFLLLYAHAARRPVLVAAAVLLAVSIKEDAILPLAGFSVAAALFERRWRPAAFALAAGLAAFFIGTLIVIPHFSGGAAGHPWYSIYWYAYGPTPLTAAFGMIRHPARVASDLARSGLPDLLEPLVVLPLAGFRWLTAALLVLLPYSVASSPHLAHFGLYYSAPVLPLLFAAGAEGLGRVTVLRSAELPPNRLRLRRRLGALLLLAFCALDGSGYRFERPHPARTQIAATVASLGGRPVGVQGSLFVRAGRAPGVRVLQPDRSQAADESILLSPDTDPYPYTRGELDALARRLSADSRYRRTDTPGGLLLFTPSAP